MYLIEQNSKKPLCVQLYEGLKNDIIENYSVGEKIPSIRKISSTYNLSKNTVETAYSQLVVEGYVESIPKSGYIVTDTLLGNFDQEKKTDIDYEVSEEVLYDFFPARLSKDSFPLKLWKRIFSKVIDESIDFGMYQNAQGEFGLRKQIALYLTKSRGVKCNPNQVVVCSSFADSMGLVSQLLKDKYKSFAIEFPGYHIARKVFDSHSFDIKNIPITKDGIDLEQLKNSKSKLVYITPSHQYPTGVAMPISNRLKLLEWA